LADYDLVCVAHHRGAHHGSRRLMTVARVTLVVIIFICVCLYFAYRAGIGG
jgi:hypothetical protein